jgi:hypothetical protein
MVYKFSRTLPTRSHHHQLLNPQQSDAFEDLKQLVHHVMLHDRAHSVAIYTCVCTWVNDHATSWRIKHGVENILLTFFFVHVK